MPNQRRDDKKKLSLWVADSTHKRLTKEASKRGVTLTEYLIQLAEEKAGRKFDR